MIKSKKVHSKIVKKYHNSIGGKEWDRELWVSEVLRLASFKYNLEERDLVKYVNNIAKRRKK